MPPALGLTLTTVPGPARQAAPPQGSCCFHWLYSPCATFSEGPGPTSPQWTASSPPFVARHLAAHTQGRGPDNLQQGQKSATFLGSIRNPPWVRSLALPSFPSACPLASKGRFLSWARQDTDCTDSQSTLFFYQIYSPDPATFMEHSRSDLFSPNPFPLEGTLGPIVTASPRAQPSLEGRPGLLRTRLPGSHLPGWPSTQGGQAGKSSPAGQDAHTPPPNSRGSPTLH